MTCTHPECPVPCPNYTACKLARLERRVDQFEEAREVLDALPPEEKS